ncbi:MAG: histidine kinase [Nitrospirae bacterium]|nr:histidine kinase [Nitrospirota bacterium]
MSHPDDMEHVFGADKKLGDVIRRDEILPLLERAAAHGNILLSVIDADGNVIASSGKSPEIDFITERHEILLEGEPAGAIIARGDAEDAERLRDTVGIIHAALTVIISSNMKRVLTTDLHTSVVRQSYTELIETNRRLAVSESKYRELAGTLERMVEDRTRELELAHTRLLQQEKMASIGQLAAGVAHEINNPMGFITSNINTLGRYAGKMREMLSSYRDLSSHGPSGAEREYIEKRWHSLKIEHIFADIDDLVHQSLEGAERVKKIVSDLKGFSHIDDGEEISIDLNAEIDRTLNVLAHEIPPDAEIVRQYGAVHGFRCNPALLCQVFLNIILNAAQARGAGLKLVVNTAEDGDGRIVITITDNGPGIPPSIIARVFDPFFTTKDVGAGTGMGLAVAYDVINRYGGEIGVDSEPGMGTTFTIRLPASVSKS